MNPRPVLALFAVLLLAGCASERQFARDALWPFGNPNAPVGGGETMQRALGQAPEVTAIAPQAGNVWPGAVQPIPTIADIEKNMNQPLGKAYTPSLPSPYPPGEDPEAQQDQQDSQDYAIPAPSPDGISPNTAPATGTSPATIYPPPAAFTPNSNNPSALTPPGTLAPTPGLGSPLGSHASAGASSIGGTSGGAAGGASSGGASSGGSSP